MKLETNQCPSCRGQVRLQFGFNLIVMKTLESGEGTLVERQANKLSAMRAPHPPSGLATGRFFCQQPAQPASRRKVSRDLSRPPTSTIGTATSAAVEREEFWVIPPARHAVSHSHTFHSAAQPEISVTQSRMWRNDACNSKTKTTSLGNGMPSSVDTSARHQLDCSAIYLHKIGQG